MLNVARMVMTSFAIARVRDTAGRLAAYAITLAIAGVIVLVALGFFLSAAWIAVARAFDPLVASLAMGIALVVIALIVWAIARARRSSARRSRVRPLRTTLAPPVAVLPVTAAPASTTSTLLTAAAMVAGAGYVAGRVLTSGRRR